MGQRANNAKVNVYYALDTIVINALNVYLIGIWMVILVNNAIIVVFYVIEVVIITVPDVGPHMVYISKTQKEVICIYLK